MPNSEMSSNIQLNSAQTPWDTTTLKNDTSWMYEFDEADRSELLAALDFFKADTKKTGLTAQWLHGHLTPSPDKFPLPRLDKVLKQFRHDLENKFGIAMFKGFPVHELGGKDLQLLYAGFSSYIGTPRPQTVFGEFVQDIKDLGQSSLIERRGSKHNRGLGLHNDPCDVNGFLCVSGASSGGEGLFASSLAIHNALQETAPQHLKILYGNFHNTYQDYLFIKNGFNDELLPTEKVYSIPTFSTEAGRLACRYSRFYIDQAQELPDIPRLTSIQLDALDAFEAELNNPKWHLEINYQPGDIVFSNNFICLHGRNPFTDDGNTASPKRHLLRIWLTVTNSRPLSPNYRHYFFQNLDAGAPRGGLPLPAINY